MLRQPQPPVVGPKRSMKDMRRIAGSMHAPPEPPPDPVTREALLAAFRDLRGTAH